MNLSHAPLPRNIDLITFGMFFNISNELPLHFYMEVLPEVLYVSSSLGQLECN